MYIRLPSGRILPALTCGALLASAAAAQTTLRTYNGITQDDRLGVSVGAAGDVNLDGFQDVIVGAPEDGFVFNLREGYARVYSGLDGSILFTINGTALAQATGLAVDGAGRVNADSNDDVVIGAPFAGASVNGQVRVYSGLNQALLHTFTGAANDEMGRAVAGAGDVNNDGRDDILVGAPNASPGFAAAGYARVYSGLTGAILHTINGPSSGARRGTSVDGVGDVNNDNFDDFIVGSLGVGATVYSGATGGVLRGPFTSALADDAFGTTVAGVGDVDGDLVPDFAIGATQDSNVFNQLPGYVQIRSGATGNLIRTHTGLANAERFGASIAGATDLDGDGRHEVLIGADQAALNLPGYVKVFDGLTGGLLHTLVGGANGDRFGADVAGCGDMNGNGKAEFVIGAPFASPVTGTKAGLARHVETNIMGGPACSTATFCVLSPNSAGPGASISHQNTGSISANNLVLVTNGLPPSPVGVYFYGAQEVATPFGNGTQCAGGPEVFRLGVSIGQMGVATFNVNYGAPAASQITAGSTWKFQYWFRDINGGGALFNLSNGLSATFCP